jgi:hypothetical protein
VAKKPDGKPASVDRVSFTRPAAERIGKAVRQVEAGDRDLGPIEWGPRGGNGGSAKVFRVGTFTGAWSIGSANTVTFRNVTTTPNTVTAINLFFPVTSTTEPTVNCGIARDGTAWYLIDVPVKIQTSTAVFIGMTATGSVITATASGSVITATASGSFITATATASYVSDVSLSASLNTSNCSITIGKTLTTATATFIAGTATATFVTGTATATFVTGTATAMQVVSTYTATLWKVEY